MRFRSVRLCRYGHFDDRAFTFDRRQGGPDLHLIVGANEAGKTTLKHALVHFLFGVPPRSPYAFRYDRPVIAAEVELDGDILALERKGRAALKPAEAADRLAAALDGADAASFLRTQAFSHHEMREHSGALHDSRGDLKDLLLRDAGGLSQAVALLDGLQKEADELYKRDGRNKSNALRQAETEWREATRRLDAATLSAEAYRDLVRAKEDAEVALDEARLAAARARAEAERLASEIRAERPVARLEELEARLAELPDVRLAAGATDRVHAAVVAEERARTALQGARERRAALEQRIQAVPADADALDAADAIEDVTARLGRLAHLAQERLNQRAEVSARHDAALASAREAGLSVPDGDASALADRLPAGVDRREAQRHAGQRDKLAERVAAARKALDETVREPPPEIPEGPSAALLSALDAVADLGRFREAWQAAAGQLAEAQEELRRREEAAAADEDCEAPPPPEEGQAAETAIADAERRLETAEERLAEAAEALSQREEDVRRATAGEVPTAKVLAAARERRDALWRTFADGRPVAEARLEYEALVREADRLADERFDRTEAIVAAERATAELAAAQRRHAALEKARDARRAERDAARAAWAERLAAAGLSAPPADYAAWHERRRARREAAIALERARDAMDALRERLRHAVSACAAALGEADAADALDGDDLLRAVDKAAEAAEAERARCEAAVNEAKSAHKAHAEAERARPQRERELAEAEEALAAWEATWRTLAARCGVAEDTTAERLQDLFAHYHSIESDLEEARKQQALAERTDAFEAQLAADLAALARRLAMAHDGDLAATGKALADRLAAARAARDEAERLADELETAREEEAARERDLEAVRNAMAEDRIAAGLPADAPARALAEAARTSDQRRQVEADRQAAIEALAAEDLGWPEARDRLSRMSPAERRSDHEAAAARVEELDAAREQAVTEATRARAELERVQGRGNATDAAEAGFAVAARAKAMGEIAADAIRRRMEVAVLQAARDAFAAENRSPVLDRASRVFDAFTGGAYDGLALGEESGESFVRAHRRADDTFVNVTGLSDGTRDQLVASVRFAAAEDSALPFIADDLFVNADDDRAANGFRMLAGLAHGRQVIYLTHHAHLVDVAAAALGEELSVVRL